MELWGTYWAIERSDEVLHPLQLAGPVGRDGSCPYTPSACNIWLSLTTSQKASALHGLAFQSMPNNCPHTLTGMFCLPPVFVTDWMHTCMVILDAVYHLCEHS